MGMKMLLHECKSVALWAWKCCFMGMKMLLHECKSVASWVWKCCFLGMKVLFHECKSVASWVWKWCFLGMKVLLYGYESVASWVWKCCSIGLNVLFMSIVLFLVNISYVAWIELKFLVKGQVYIKTQNPKLKENEFCIRLYLQWNVLLDRCRLCFIAVEI